MASIRIRCFCLLSCLLLLLLLLLETQTHAAGSQSQSQWNSADKVKLDLYYESLCPYCANFIVNLLPPIFQNGLIHIIDLKFYPWGNAKIVSDHSIACQHGPSECLLNEIDACALDVWPSLSEHFPFIYCVESLVYKHKYSEWETCFQTLGLDPKPITECYSSGHGKELVLKYGAETNALEPAKKYVPWVVVDGQPLYEEYEEFMSYVCKAYKGTPAPSACSELSSHSHSRSRGKTPVGYTVETEEEAMMLKEGYAAAV